MTIQTLPIENNAIDIIQLQLVLLVAVEHVAQSNQERAFLADKAVDRRPLPTQFRLDMVFDVHGSFNSVLSTTPSGKYVDLHALKPVFCNVRLGPMLLGGG